MAKIDESVKKKVPELRFKGFTDDWEERKLKDVTERVRSNDGRMDLPTLTMSASSGWLDQKDRFSGDISGKEKKNYTLLKKGELSYNHGNSKLAKYGVVFSLTNYEEALVPRVYHSFKALENTSADFIEYMFSTKLPDRELGKLVSSGARMDGLLNINYDDFMNIHISIPNYEEQILMSAFFRKLDETIALHQRKLDLLKEQKKGFLQKMFPKNGAKVPELRFAGFADDWVQRKLADVVSISAGGDVDKTKLIEDGGYPVLANALTNSGIVGYYDSYKVEAPAVTVTGRGDVGHAVARHVNFTPVVRLLSLKSEVLDADFLANMLNQTNILVESTGVPQLTAPQLGSYKILYPNLNEQTKIGKLLNAFDNLIAANQRKLDLLKEQKKGFLQNMFV